MSRKIFSLIFTLFLIIIISCSNDEVSIPSQVDGNTLRTLVNSAVRGDISANKKLSGLVEANANVNQPYNRLTIDSAKIEGKKYFSVLIEYPNPRLNLLAIYDEYLNFYLLDKSLNGNLAESWKTTGSKTYLFVSEKFLSKDVLKIERTSVYTKNSEQWHLIYRYYSKFEMDGNIYSQSIEKFSFDKITTSFTSTDTKLKPGKDTFIFRGSSEKYESTENIFNSFVEKQVNDFKWIPVESQPTDTKSDLTSPLRRNSDYFINPTDKWKEVLETSLKSKFHSELSGNMYVNPGFGATISIAKIDYTKGAEDFCNYKFNLARAGNYKVRDSGLMQKDNYVIRILEYSCGEKKFLIMLECTKYSYQENKNEIESILNSFSINC